MISAITVLLILQLFMLIPGSDMRTRFPDIVLNESGQRKRSNLAKLGRQQNAYLTAATIFLVVFAWSLVFVPEEFAKFVPEWQRLLLLFTLPLILLFSLGKLIKLYRTRRRLGRQRDAITAIGHACQRLDNNRNQVFHDVDCNGASIDHVLVGLHGIYAVHVLTDIATRRNAASIDGDVIEFANGQSLSVQALGECSNRFAHQLRKETGSPVHVRTVIAIPGCEIDTQNSEDFLLVNERNLAMLTGWKDERDHLLNEDVDAIHEALRERCAFKRN